jgi:glycosyltransferase involved in cell wall biosynthesis
MSFDSLLAWIKRGKEDGVAAVDPPTPSYDVLVFPVIDWYDRFQRPQQLSLEFARRGYRVFYFSNRFVPALCVCEPGAKEVATNVFYVQLPGSVEPPDIFRDVPREVHVAAIENGVRQVRQAFHIRSTLSIVDYPFWAPILRCVPNTIVFYDCIFYDCMDDWASFANAGRPARELEPEMARAADLVACSSAHLQEGMRKIGRESLLIRNAVDVAHFATAPPTLAWEPNGRTVGYWGALAEWTDIDLLIYAARALPDVRFVLIGQVLRIDVSELATLPNVVMPGEVPYARLPEYLHAFDVCLLPYRICDYALASDPVKVWEYLSAGKPVVAVRFPEIERLGGLITLTATPAEFVAGIQDALSGEDGGAAEIRKRFARENTW